MSVRSQLRHAALRASGHRWAVVLVLPPVPDLNIGIVRHAMRKDLTETEARRQVAEVLALPDVARAVVEDGAYVELGRLDRHGFVIPGTDPEHAALRKLLHG